MSVWKRTWTNKDGKTRHAWVADYYNSDGDRHVKSFATKADAETYLSRVRIDIKDGVHVAPRKSITVKAAAESWLKRAENDGLERATVDQYRQHINLHVVPLIGDVRLCNLTPAAARQFEDRLHETGRSPSMTRKVMGSLGALIADAYEQGKCARNAVRELSKQRRRKKGQTERRHKRKLEVGVDIPTPAEIKLTIDAAANWRPLLMTVALTGMRASELRGLRWCDVDFAKGEIRVRQRADRYSEIGSPKSASSERCVPFPPYLGSELKAWKLKRKGDKRDTDLVFGNGNGNPESLANIINRGLCPAQVAAGVTVPILDAKGKPKLAESKPMVKAKYTGMHALRHFYASWCLGRKEDGGLGHPIQLVSKRMGHSSITITIDTYCHLLPPTNDVSELDAAARSLLG